MATNVVPITPSNVYSAHQIELMKRTVAADTNSAEFDLFVTVARHTGLDPFRKQISALVFNKGDAEKRRMVIITTIDGLRVTAARSGRYRPDEDEPEFEFDPDLKSECNPLGLVKAVVSVFISDAQGGSWRRVRGVAYWDEFAPIKEEGADGFEWVDTGETYPAGHAKAGRPKFRKVPVGEVVRKLDTSGNWGKMPRLMLAKCAEAQALRKAFPEDLSGIYEGAELDRAKALDDVPASELLVQHQAAQRLEKAGAANTILFQFLPNEPLQSVPLGKLADRIIETAEGFTSLAQARWFMETNTHPLREFWARAPGDALEVKKKLEAIGAKLQEAEAAAEAEVEADHAA